MSERRLTVPLDSDLYMWLTELTIRQQDRGVFGSKRQRIGKDRAISRILAWAKSQPQQTQDQIFDDLITDKAESN